MKNIVLKTPTAIFVILVILPIVFLAYESFTGVAVADIKTLRTLGAISSIVKWIWLFSVIDYFQSKVDNFKYLKLLYFLIFLDSIFILLFIFSITGTDLMSQFTLIAIQYLVFIVTTVLITLLIHVVFYERAVWFIVLEILLLVVGVITLTPEIKRHAKEISV